MGKANVYEIKTVNVYWYDEDDDFVKSLGVSNRPIKETHITEFYSTKDEMIDNLKYAFNQSVALLELSGFKIEIAYANLDSKRGPIGFEFDASMNGIIQKSTASVSKRK